MVVLLLTAIDQQEEVRNFTCHLPDLDTGFDLLTAVARMGHTLIQARILEENKWTQLPPDAFDQEPISPVIKELEKEWQQVLNKPNE